MKIVIDLPYKTYCKILSGEYDYGDMNIIIRNGVPIPTRRRGLISENDKVERGTDEEKETKGL